MSPKQSRKLQDKHLIANNKFRNLGITDMNNEIRSSMYVFCNNQNAVQYISIVNQSHIIYG